ncbi:LysR family transcriptional regulator [Bradyrhizobium sp. 930_D9_N1_4]|uniref:LysR family transcriptional regulator n=1 Tax=Bradyrhizobium sp. 930_D9_N1_4 TaxID=3240374 RepID=UPI003F8A6D0B
MKAFVAVADAGSVNRAAIMLRLTQPATTRRIQSFEQQFGDAPLFNRAVKPAVLTALGTHVLEHCRRVLAAVAELESCAAKAADPTGDMKAGVAHGLGEMVMTTPLDALRRRFPRARLQVSSDWSTNLIAEVRSGALDCAVGLLTEAHAVPAGLVRVVLGAEQVVIVGPKSAGKRGGRAYRLRDLAERGWFLNPPGCGCRAALVKAFDRLSLPLNVAAEVFGEDLQLSLLARSGGLGLVPRRQFEHSPHRRSLRILNVADFTLPASVALIRRSTPGRFDPAIELLTTELKARMA